MASFEELNALVECVLFVSDMQFQLASVSIQRPLFQVPDISTIMTRRVVSSDYLIFIMGIPIVARLHLQIEIVSWLLKTSEHGPLTRYVQLRVAHAPGMSETFSRRRLQRKPLLSDPGMHHGTCVTHVPWCMSGSLTWCGGGNVPGIPGACTTRNFTYLARGLWSRVCVYPTYLFYIWQKLQSLDCILTVN